LCEFLHISVFVIKFGCIDVRMDIHVVVVSII
jgi:hypothetical protein